jgi:hypothetical protein
MTVFYHNILFLPTSVCKSEIQVKVMQLGLPVNAMVVPPDKDKIKNFI